MKGDGNKKGGGGEEVWYLGLGIKLDPDLHSRDEMVPSQFCEIY